jgi:hypothetical protein
MRFLLCNLAVVAVAVIVFWWLSGFDSRLSGEAREDFARRALRCGITLIIVEIGFYELWRCWLIGDRSAGLAYLSMLIPMALIWVGCISEAGSQYFHHLIDPQDKRPYDPKAGLRELDGIGHLLRSGRKEEAIQLCRTLLQTSPEHRAAAELTLHHVGAPVPELPQKSKPLADAARLRQTGKFVEAEAILISLLEKEPLTTDAALMLIRLYGQDLRQPDKAMEVLRSLENAPHVPAAYIEFARRSIMEWQTSPANTPKEEPIPQSIDELIAKKYLGTAIDILEKQCESEPENFASWLKLAEVHGVNCANLQLAEKVIRRIEANLAFTSEQKQQARHQLEAWRHQ